MEDIGRLPKSQRKLIRQGRRAQRRLKWKKAPGEVGKVQARIGQMLAKGGDVAETPLGTVVVPNGVVPHIIQKSGYQVVIMGPAAAIDEAVARFESPNEAPEDPGVELNEIADTLVERGDVSENDPALGAIAEAQYQALGCAACNAQGATMGEIAEDVAGIIPLIVKAAKGAANVVDNALRKEYQNDRPQQVTAVQWGD